MLNLTPETIVLAFIWYVVFLFSTTCHEAAHALAAKLQGDETAALGGQVTLNPVPHIRREPWGMVVVPIVTVIFSKASYLFGWASAPFDPEWQRRYPKKSAIMAIAGPAANFTLMFVGVIGIQVGRHYQVFTQESWGTFAANVLFILFSLNLLLGIFNLVPAPPLDGSTAIMLFMKESTAHRYLTWLREGNFGSMALIGAIVAFYYGYGYVDQFFTRILIQTRFF
ncbi:MAG TPA: site-2 protease family protein [Candidatus Acidoferrum sp.]|jgi:Zn-dependent protease|nr:site-2 protease family protein [Candidatus Acidoferrum sp.]